MPTATSVVTQTRYAQGLSWADFVAQAAVNRDKLERNFPSAPVSEDDFAFFRAVAALPGGPRKILAIAEAWCGDVCRELPTAARIAEATGLELRIFLRDQNPDIMDEFLSNEGRSRSIPVFVFYTEDLQYLCHFTERSALASAELVSLAEEVQARMPEADPQTQRRELIAALQRRTEAWRTATVRELRGLLSKAMKIPVVYTIRGCDSCVKLLAKWESEGRAWDERRAELRQEVMDEARRFGDMVPIIVWPDGKVEQGFEGSLGCFL